MTRALRLSLVAFGLASLACGLRLTLQEFRHLYNRALTLKKQGYLTPSQARARVTTRQRVAS